MNVKHMTNPELIAHAQHQNDPLAEELAKRLDTATTRIRQVCFDLDKMSEDIEAEGLS
jgi:hypothetical protein